MHCKMNVIFINILDLELFSSIAGIVFTLWVELMEATQNYLVYIF